MARRKITEVERNIMKEISKNLRKILKDTGWNQKELAEKVGLSTSVMSDYLNEKTMATPGSVQMMADALGLEKGDIDPSFKSNTVNTDSEKKKRMLKILSELNDDEMDILLLTAERFLKK